MMLRDKQLIPTGIVARHVRAIEQATGYKETVSSSSSSSDCGIENPSSKTSTNPAPWRSTTRWVWQDGSPLGWEPAGFPEPFNFDYKLRDTSCPPWQPRGTLLCGKRNDAQSTAAAEDTAVASNATDNRGAGDQVAHETTTTDATAHPATSVPPRPARALRQFRSSNRRQLVQAARALQVATRQDTAKPHLPAPPSPLRVAPSQEADARCVWEMGVAI